MNRHALVPLLTLLPCAALAAGAAPATAPAAGTGGAMRAYLEGGRSVPLFAATSERVAVARVDRDPITLGELNDALAGAHEGAGGGARREDLRPIVDRLVDVRLLALEARDMQLGELPEVKAAIAVFRDRELRAELEQQVTKGAKPDAMEVQWIYRDAVRRFSVRSVLVHAEADAKALDAEVRGGKPFVDAAKAALAAKKATGDVAPQLVGAEQMQPQVAAAVAKLGKGQTTGPIQVQGGFALVHVDDVRYPDDLAARAKARQDALERKRDDLLRTFREGLERRYAKLDTGLLRSLDFEAAKPGLPALQKDRRPLVTIRGEKPITVGDLADELVAGFFHGVESPIKEKRVNTRKDETIRQMITRRLFLAEARRRGIDRSPAFRAAVAGFEREQLVGKLIEKAILPDVKVQEKEGLDYYAAHAADFTYPAFYRLEGLAFRRQADAQGALKRLQEGTEFAWLRRNADGQVPHDQRSVQLEGTTFSATALAPELAKALAGARRGDYRLYEAPGPQWYVVHVVDVTPPKEQPYKAVRDGIVKRLFAQNLAKGIHEYAAKLRKAHAVHVYITRIGA